MLLKLTLERLVVFLALLAGVTSVVSLELSEEEVGERQLDGASLVSQRESSPGVFLPFEEIYQAIENNDNNEVSYIVNEVVDPSLSRSKDSCAAQSSCEECYDTHTCHWCDNYQSCHTKGSIYGCTWGSTCSKDGNHTDPPSDNNHTIPPGNSSDDSSKSCAARDSCEDCYNTHTCHWCESDQACHARGSIYGCKWGDTCKKPDGNKTDSNTTCASHKTCSDCTLSSHFCHWCEHDNACHAVGSKYGCVTGVDCYSNDRCRRAESEKFKYFIFTQMPTSSMVILILVGASLCGCFSCCFYLAGGVKGAYDDLASITMAATVPPSVIGPSLMMGPPETIPEAFSTNLDTHQESGEEMRELDGQFGNRGNGPERDEEADNELGNQNAGTNCDFESPFIDGNDVDDSELLNEDNALQTPLLPRRYPYGDASFVSEPTHMGRLYKACTVCYVLSIITVMTLVLACMYVYPATPIYNVCNDSVAWKKIIENVAALKLDASFEILISLSNPNRVDVALDRATGGFKFDGNYVGTFEIPPVILESMAITDLMLIAHVSPDRYQALQLAEAYYMGKLLLDADFTATIRIPFLDNYVKHVSVDNIPVNVTEQSDRSLCACPSWDDAKNSTGPSIPLFLS